ncbi:hypothetical protein, partial [Oscillibacter sp. CU971]|uniref:hypothetical protein n=1 Tax=Oscillibacter sp. CU971 TaxID=2780102 RepID=UPI0019594BCB
FPLFYHIFYYFGGLNQRFPKQRVKTFPSLCFPRDEERNASVKFQITLSDAPSFLSGTAIYYSV